MTEAPPSPETKGQRWLETFKERLAFLYEEIIIRHGERLIEPEIAERLYGMELFPGKDEPILPVVPLMVKELVRGKLGIDLDSRPRFRVVDPEGNVQMVGWRMKNPDWILLRWDREEGPQLLTYEETLLSMFTESLGLEAEEL